MVTNTNFVLTDETALIQSDPVELTCVGAGLSRYITSFVHNDYTGHVLLSAILPKREINAANMMRRIETIAHLYPEAFPQFNALAWAESYRTARFWYEAQLVETIPISKAPLTPVEHVVVLGTRRVLYHVTDVRPYTGTLTAEYLSTKRIGITRVNQSGEGFTAKLAPLQVNQLYDLCSRLEFNQRAALLDIPDRVLIDGHPAWFILSPLYEYYRARLMRTVPEHGYSMRYPVWRKRFMRWWGELLVAGSYQFSDDYRVRDDGT